MASREITKEDIVEALKVIKSVCEVYEETGACDMCPFGSDEEGEDNECMITQNGAPSAWTVSTACDTWRALR